MQNWPSVSIVIPVLDEPEALTTALKSVAVQDYPGPLEVVVADGNPSTTTDRIERPAGIPMKVVRNPATTTPAGLNAGIAAASGEVVVRCDAHSVLPTGYVRRAVETLARTNADNVGGVQRATGTEPTQRAIAAAMSSPVGVGDARFHLGGPEGPTDTVYLGVFAKSTLERLGGFDESLARNQDYELNWRIRESGGLVWFDPELEVEYRPRRSLRALGHQYWDYGRWKRHVLRLHPNSLRWRQLAPPALVLLYPVLVALAVLRPRWWVVAGLYPATIIGEGLRQALGRDEIRIWPRAAAAFAVMHWSWGSGFLFGRVGQ